MSIFIKDKNGTVIHVGLASYMRQPVECIIQCDYISCVHGCGLAGSGNCSASGMWWGANCPEFETEEEMMECYQGEL